MLILGLIAFFLAFFYTAPPLNLGARGLGEVDVMLSFTMISFFSYFVIAQELALVPVLIAVTIGLNAMNMRIVDEMSGLEAHQRTGEKDLVVILGVDGAANHHDGHHGCHVRTLRRPMLFRPTLPTAFPHHPAIGDSRLRGS